MLVLENRIGRAAFRAERLDAVMLIAGQLAVSLANAQLYENLEQRVHARTRELERAQAELVATARKAGMAEIANNVLHNVGNVLNSVTVSASVVKQTLGHSRTDGLSRAVMLLNEHRSDLSAFMANDTRAGALLPYLNELVKQLEQERQGALDELERLTGSVEHIGYVVAAQQSHSGSSKLMEYVVPETLLEEALRLAGDGIASGAVEIHRNYQEIPPAPLDRQRILQILVNLIGNAVQAMQSTPHADRRLNLASRVVGEDGHKRLHLVVQDAGEGIPAENLHRIFAHGFTTRPDGHGYGLHSSALAAVEMGGRLAVQSEGPGHGAVFTVELPLGPG